MKTIEIKTQIELEKIQETGVTTLVKFKGTAKDLFIVKGDKILSISFFKTIGWVSGDRREHSTKKAAIEHTVELIEALTDLPKPGK